MIRSKRDILTETEEQRACKENGSKAKAPGRKSLCHCHTSFLAGMGLWQVGGRQWSGNRRMQSSTLRRQWAVADDNLDHVAARENKGQQLAACGLW